LKDPAFQGAAERVQMKFKENMHTPLILIDKEEIKEKQASADDPFLHKCTLNKIAFLVPKGPNKYLIKGPENISDCTLVHVCYLFGGSN
jgi:hypothetical protein